MLGWLLNTLQGIFYRDYLIFFLEPFFESRLVDSSIAGCADFYIFLNSYVPPIGRSFISSSEKFLIELFLCLKIFSILFVDDYDKSCCVFWNDGYYSVYMSGSSSTFFMTLYVSYFLNEGLDLVVVGKNDCTVFICYNKISF